MMNSLFLFQLYLLGSHKLVHLSMFFIHPLFLYIIQDFFIFLSFLLNNLLQMLVLFLLLLFKYFYLLFYFFLFLSELLLLIITYLYSMHLFYIMFQFLLMQFLFQFHFHSQLPLLSRLSFFL